VHGLVTAHGGTVSVHTAPGQGADFRVKLPLSPDAQVEDIEDDLSAARRCAAQAFPAVRRSARRGAASRTQAA
jgi:hypothetical protein